MRKWFKNWFCRPEEESKPSEAPKSELDRLAEEIGKRWHDDSEDIISYVEDHGCFAMVKRCKRKDLPKDVRYGVRKVK